MVFKIDMLHQNLITLSNAWVISPGPDRTMCGCLDPDRGQPISDLRGDGEGQQDNKGDTFRLFC